MNFFELGYFMQNKLIGNLNEINNLNRLSQFIDDLEAKDIGILGGRKFKRKAVDDGEIALNDLVRKFDDLRDQIAQNENLAIEIRRKIHHLDETANLKLNQTSWFTQLMTRIRSALGVVPRKVKPTDFFFPTRDQVLRDLVKSFKADSLHKHVYLAEELFDETSGQVEEDAGSVSLSALKNSIVKAVEQRVKDPVKGEKLPQHHEQKLIDDFEAFLKRSIVDRSRVYKDENFIKKLLYFYRKSDDQLLRTELPILILVAYAKAKGYRNTGFSASSHPLSQLSVSLGEEENWRPSKDDSSLMASAEARYKTFS